jgi:hypothetical protein
MAQCITCSDFKKGYVSVRTEVLYNLLIEYGMPRNIDGLIKMCLNETYSTVLIGKICPTVFSSERPETRKRFLSIAFIFAICQ